MSVSINKALVRGGAVPQAPSRSHLVTLEPESIRDGIKENTTSIFEIPTRSAPGQYLNCENSYMSFELEVKNTTGQNLALDRDVHSLIEETEVQSSGAPVARDYSWQRLHSILQDCMVDYNNLDKSHALLQGGQGGHAAQRLVEGEIVAGAATTEAKLTYVMPLPSQFFAQPNNKYIPTHKVDNLSMRIRWNKFNRAFKGHNATASPTDAEYKINKLTLHLDFMECGAQTMAQIESASPAKVAGSYWELHKDVIPKGVSSHITRVPCAKSSLKTMISGFYDQTTNTKDINAASGSTSTVTVTGRNTNAVDEIVHMVNSEPIPTLPLRNLQENGGNNLKIVAAELQRSLHQLFKSNANAFGKSFMAQADASTKRTDASNTFVFGCSTESHGTGSNSMSGVSTLQANPQIHMKFAQTPAVMEMETCCQYDVSFEYVNGQILLSQ